MKGQLVCADQQPGVDQDVHEQDFDRKVSPHCDPLGKVSLEEVNLEGEQVSLEGSGASSQDAARLEQEQK